MECNPMKTTIFLPLMLCCVVAAAQDNTVSQNLPELQEWYSWKGSIFTTGGKVSYLPGFDSLGGGLNAITQHRGGDPVWYNRFPFDTVKQFSWKSGGAFDVYQLDANGDGIPDYFDTKGRVYRGRKGQKPESEPAVILSRGGTKNPLIGDMNNDGNDDLLAYNDESYLDIVFGNKDLSAMTRITVHFPVETSHYVGGYFSESGKPRIIFYYDWGSFESFAIYALNITYTGNKPTISFEQLDIIRTFKSNSSEKIYELSLSTLTTIYKEPLGIFTRRVTSSDPYASEGDFYTIQNDKFKFLFTDTRSFGTPFFLRYSADKDTTPDLVRAQKGIFYLFSGYPQKSSLAKAIIPLSSSCSNVIANTINDVNNDGINDVAFGADGCFSVYLGLDWRKVGVNEVAEYNSFKIHQNIPNPVQKDRKTLLPVSLKQQGSYTITLYSLQGNKIKELFTSELSEGDHKIPLDLMGLSAGMYIVKMNNGSVSRERAIMIGE